MTEQKKNMIMKNCPLLAAAVLLLLLLCKMLSFHILKIICLGEMINTNIYAFL